MDVQEADDTEDAFRKAEELFHPAEDLEFEIYKFRPAKQLPRENISANFTRLKKYCEFHDQRREIKTQIVQNSCLSKLRRKALADPEIMLEKLIQIAKSMELSEVQAAINSKRKPAAVKLIKIGTKAKRKFSSFQHVLGKNNCPAYGKQCRGCQKWNYFKAFCNEKREGSKRNEQSEFPKRNEQSKFSKRSDQSKSQSFGKQLKYKQGRI